MVNCKAKMKLQSIKLPSWPRAIRAIFSMPFLCLALLYLLFRLAVAASCLHYIYTPDDIFTMKLVAAWSRGQPVLGMLRFPTFNFGGDLLNALLFYPIGRLFWPSYFSIKVFAIIEGLAIMWMWYFLIRSCFKRLPAVIFCLLYIFAPHFFVVFSMISLGYHFETGLIQAPACILFILMLNPKNTDGSRMRWAFAVGAAIGVGLFWSYLFLITLGAIGAVWLFVDARRIGLKPSFVAVATGLLVGVALYWTTSTPIHFWDKGVGDIISLRPNYLSAVWHNLISTSRIVPDLSLGDGDNILGYLFGFDHSCSTLYRGLFVFSLAALVLLAIRENYHQRSLALLVLFDIIFFYLVYTQISFVRFGNPYRITLYPFVFAAISLVPVLSRSWVLRIPYGLALSVILAAGLFNAVSIIDTSKFGTLRDFRGIEYFELTDQVDPYMVADLNAFIDWSSPGSPEAEMMADGFSDRLSRGSYHADFNPSSRWYQPLSPDQVANIIERSGKGPAYGRGFCWAASLCHGQDTGRLFEALDPVLRLHCIEGIGMARAAAGEPRDADPTIVQGKEEIEAMARGRDLFEKGSASPNAR